MSTVGQCEQLITSYLQHMEHNLKGTPTDDGCVVLTPFIRPDGEAIELAVVMQSDGRFRLTDMGDTLGYLYVNGLTLSRAVLENVRKACRRFDTSLEGATLAVPLEEQLVIGEGLHRLVQTVLEVTALIQKRRPIERITFDAEVESLIIISGRVYDPDYAIQGQRSVHEVRFHVNSNRRMLIQPLSAASESGAFAWAERWAYRFDDILRREDRWHCIAILDDRGEKSQIWSDRALRPIRNFAIQWQVRDELSAMLI